MKRFYTIFQLLTVTLFFNHLFAQDIQVFNSTTTPVFTGNNFKAIGIGKDGYIWAGTQYQGLYRYDPVFLTWTKMPDLTNVFINDIKTDKAGGIWIAQSGTSGSSGGGSNIAGGVNYYFDPFANTQFFSVTNTTGISSRNVRSIWIDTSLSSTSIKNMRVAQASFITSSTTTAGGIGNYINFGDNFSKVTTGLQVFPYVSQAAAGTPSCLSVGGNAKEYWVFAQTNFGRSQILRYSALLDNNSFLGYYDNTNTPTLTAGFKANAIYFDLDNRQWLGMANGGILVKNDKTWKFANVPIAPGFAVNNNAITADDEGNIYFGTSNGLLVYTGGEIDSIGSYRVLTTSDGLPSNYISHLAFDKITGRLLIATDAGVAFLKTKKKISIKMVWDNSFPMLSVQPRGVAADGVSRLYVKIKRGTDTIPKFTNVEVKIKNYDGANPTVFGKLKTASYNSLNKYTNEASSGTLTQTSRTDSTAQGEFWFWYVSPEDFCNNNTSAEAKLSERNDTVMVIVTYPSNRKDTGYLAVKVVRPPLVLVHGLASNPSAWDNFVVSANTIPPSTIPFVNNPLFKYKHAMKMDGRTAFINNAKMLVAGDIGYGQGTARLSTLQGNIEEIRKMGYAANQVYYVCHSMGGIMARCAIRWYSDKYLADGNYRYNNYGKGFIHKLITINTPHNGAVPGDLVGEFIPQAPQTVNIALNELYSYFPDEQIPFDFIVPDQYGVTSKFGPSPAVSNLSIAKKYGGIQMVATNVRYHMITGDVALVPAFVTSVLSASAPYIKMLNFILEAARALSPEPIRSVLTGFIKLGQVLGAMSFMEWAHTKNNFPGYLNGSDLIVPLLSETARQSPDFSLHITKYTGFSAWHSSILGRTDVGDRVLELLNTKVSSNFYADIIPANNDVQPPARPLSGTYNKIITSYDTAKIKITEPVPGTNSFADSVINIKFKLKDTVGLAYVRIHFQNTDSVTFVKTALQTVSFTVTPDFGGKQKITVSAVYDKPDTTKYHVDTVSVSVGNNAVLQGFRVTADQVDIISGTPYFPTYNVKYNNNWVNLPGTDSNITVTFSPAGFVSFDNVTKSFNALQEGFALAFVQYKGFVDTIMFTTGLNIYTNCVNKTIASGSFKNPLIWSKGVVPDVCDSIVIDAGHTVSADTTVRCTSLRINNGGTLNVNNALVNLQLGATDDGTSMLDNYGTLNVSLGKLTVAGRVKLNAGSTFNMSNGTIVIDGNTGDIVTSLKDSLNLFDVSAAMQSFAFTGGTLQITDPPYGENSQAIKCTYNFGDTTVLVFGNGQSTTYTNNINGFGGNLLPAKIGGLTIDAATLLYNRIFKNLNPLTVKKKLEVKSGKVVQGAALNIVQ